MLGNHADAFFRRQSRERVKATTPNAHGGSYAPRDLERPGTKIIAGISGNYQTPGPQRTVPRDYLPGMGQAEPTGHLPAPQPVNTITRSMLPGMGQANMLTRSMLPGMGSFADTAKALVPISLVVGVGYLLLRGRAA